MEPPGFRPGDSEGIQGGIQGFSLGTPSWMKTRREAKWLKRKRNRKVRRS